MEAYLDNVFQEAAERRFAKISGKRCKYRLDAMGYTVNKADHGKTGVCTIVGLCYSPMLDCEVYTLRDEKNGTEFSVCEFEVYLEDM